MSPHSATVADDEYLDAIELPRSKIEVRNVARSMNYPRAQLLRHQKRRSLFYGVRKIQHFAPKLRVAPTNANGEVTMRSANV